MLVKTHHRLNQIGQRLLVAGPLAVIVSLSNVGVSPSHAAINTSSTGQGFTVTPADLAYILKQIKISEYHVANTTSETGPCGALVGQGPNQVPTPLLSFGLRTVDGSCNNLQSNQETYGASHQAFPRLTNPVFKGAENTTFDPDGDGPQNAGDATAYSQTSGAVFDSEPRVISNLIVDQTSTNPAAVQVAANPFRTQANPDIVEPCETDANGVDLVPATPVGCVPQYHTLFIPNITTDVGLSPPFNSLFTIFGQFFDHGLDKITNGGTGDVFIPLKDDDPMVAGPDHRFGTNCGTAEASAECADNLPPQKRFMIPLSRGTIMTGPDGFRSAPNTDTPFVDQSQTYTSHPSHQVFTREYSIPEGTNLPPVATGKFVSESDGGLPTWKTVKAQAENKLGLKLTDTDVHNIPQIAVDAYGNFIPGPARGLPQYVTPSGLVEGCRPAIDDCPLDELGQEVAQPVPNNVIRIGAAFLNDIAHSADPGKIGAPKTRDGNTTAGGSLDPVASTEYDDELLDLHFICGDGRCNENIALTAVHQVFHSEHDRLIDYFTNPINGVLTQNPDLLAQFQDVNPLPGPDKTFTYGERLFQAARFVTEMEYQHLVFEEFARKVQPAINPFEPFAFNQTDVNPAITAEFAHAVYRFGHSMLTDKIPRVNSSKSVDAGAPLRNDIPLFDGFLNPAAFKDGGKDANGNSVLLSAPEATGAILMGLSDQAGNEIDEFVTESLRNHLLGLPLDLPSINMARARSEGIPSLNNVRKQIYAATNDQQMKPYANWVDFDQNLKHHESLVNFIAAYGKHPTIVNAQTLAGKRAAANEIVNGTTVADAADFMFSTGDWANVNGVSKTGVDDIDLWIGGLAENTNLFGGLLGSTFNYVFEKQLTDLQNGDRFYYLARTPGMNLRTQLEGNSFAELVMRNTPSHTLKADPFATADCKFELANLHSPYVPGTDPVPVSSTLTPPLAPITGPGSVNDDPLSECDENQLLLFQSNGTIKYRSVNNVDPPGINGQSVYNGTEFADEFYGGNDNDTFWGGLGDDTIDGGGGDDVSIGGEGDDVITDFAGNDILKGGPGNDAMDGGIGDDILMGADGKDFTNGGANINETFGGPDDDFAIAGQGTDAVFGDSGDDWEEGNDQPDLLIGDSSTLFFDDHNLPGHDILIGQGGDDDYDMEGGDDIGVAGPGVEKVAGAAGYDWEIGLGDPQPQNADLALVIVNAPPVNETRDRYNEVEALSGWKFNDILRGDSVVPSQVGGGGFIGCDALDANGVARISGLDALVPESIRTVDSAQVVANSVSHYCQLTGLVWGEGNILLGGAGSDQLEGRGANDILDGDRYLNVRLSVRNGADDVNGVDTVRDGTGAEIGSTRLMTTMAVTGSFGPGTTGMTLQEAVFARKVNPGNIVAVREILTPNVPAADCGALTPLNCDTALFSGPQANYTITPNADGSLTVTDNGGGGVVNDGSDTLWNIEQLGFCDEPDPVVKGVCRTPAAPVPVGPGATLSASSLAFGNQVVGTTSALRNITISNTGITTLNVSGVTLNGANAGEFSLTNGCTTVLPNSTCTIRVAFSPSTSGTKTASISIAHNAVGSPSSVSVSGTGTVGVPAISLSSTSLSFGNQIVGTTSAPRNITVNNTGNANLIVSGVTVSGASIQFSVSNNCSTVLPGSSCTISVDFSPLTTGTKTAAISIAHNAVGSPTAVSLSGTGINAPTTATIANTRIGPTTGVPVGSSATGTVLVRNTGTATLFVTGVRIGAPFTANRGTCRDPVPVGGTCRLNVTFRPTAPIAYSVTLRIVSNASNNPTATIRGLGR